MFKYKLTSKPSFQVNNKIIDNVFHIMWKNISIKQNWTLNIVFSDSQNIQELNKTYRNINKATDVLSFHYFENFENLKDDEIAWEIILCAEKIISQWKEYWLWEEKELYKLLIHSILHILWYDHEQDDDYTIMQEKETLIWEKVFEI